MKQLLFIGPSWVHEHPLFQGVLNRLREAEWEVVHHDLGGTHFLAPNADLPPVEAALFIDAVSPKRVAPKQFMFRFETNIVVPVLWQHPCLEEMDAIFTWDDTLIERSPRYVKLNFPYDVPPLETLWFNHHTVQEYWASKTHSITLINGHKVALAAGELYQERIKLIRVLEKEYPKHFDLYGTGWNEMAGLVGARTLKWNLLRRIRTWVPNALRPLLFDETITFKPYPSYKGSIPDKFAILAKYRFAICYENADNRQGYITEKLWDCLVAGCIPVYWGAPNISDYFPSDCYIDATRFTSRKALIKYLLHLPEADQIALLEAGATFLRQRSSHPTFALFETHAQAMHIFHSLERLLA
jgi:alpha(1,3/1,4) fucosyltransferase